MIYLFLALVVSLAYAGLKICDAYRAHREAELRTLLQAVANAAFQEGFQYGYQRAHRITPDRPGDSYLSRVLDEIDEMTGDV